MPVACLHRDFFVNELPALGKDEVATFRLATLPRAQCSDEDPLAVREQRIRELFLYKCVRKLRKAAGKMSCEYLGLPFALRGRSVCAETVDIIVQARKIWVYISEPACLIRAASCE